MTYKVYILYIIYIYIWWDIYIYIMRVTPYIKEDRLSFLTAFYMYKYYFQHTDLMTCMEKLLIFLFLSSLLFQIFGLLQWHISVFPARKTFDSPIKDSTALTHSCIFLLTHFMPLIFFDTPENIRKPLFFWYFQGVSKEISGMKWVTKNFQLTYLLTEFVFNCVKGFFIKRDS